MREGGEGRERVASDGMWRKRRRVCPRLFALHRGGGRRSYIVNFGMVALACNFVFIL